MLELIFIDFGKGAMKTRSGDQASSLPALAMHLLSKNGAYGFLGHYLFSKSMKRGFCEHHFYKGDFEAFYGANGFGKMMFTKT